MALSKDRAVQVLQKAARVNPNFGRTLPGVIAYYNSRGLTYIVIETHKQATDRDLDQLSEMLRADEYLMVNETVIQFAVHPRSWIG